MRRPPESKFSRDAVDLVQELDLGEVFDDQEMAEIRDRIDLRDWEEFTICVSRIVRVYNIGLYMRGDCHLLGNEFGRSEGGELPRGIPRAKDHRARLEHASVALERAMKSMEFLDEADRDAIVREAGGDTASPNTPDEEDEWTESGQWVWGNIVPTPPRAPLSRRRLAVAEAAAKRLAVWVSSAAANVPQPEKGAPKLDAERDAIRSLADLYEAQTGRRAGRINANYEAVEKHPYAWLCEQIVGGVRRKVGLTQKSLAGLIQEVIKERRDEE